MFRRKLRWLAAAALACVGSFGVTTAARADIFVVERGTHRVCDQTPSAQQILVVVSAC